MQAVDYDHNAFTDQGTAEADKHLLVRFFIKQRPSKNKDDVEEDGSPKMVDVEYLEIRVPGKKDPQWAGPAKPIHMQRFSEHYRRFKQRTEAPTEGWPLSEWSGVTDAQVDRLSFINIKTVEQLATASDTHIRELMGGYGLKRSAQEALQDRNSASSLRKENEDMRRRLEALENQAKVDVSHETSEDKTETEVNEELVVVDIENEETVKEITETEEKPVENVTEVTEKPARKRRSRRKQD